MRRGHLYLSRNSKTDANARIHIATFDTGEGDAYNSENCQTAEKRYSWPSPALPSAIGARRGVIGSRVGIAELTVFSGMLPLEGMVFQIKLVLARVHLTNMVGFTCASFGEPSYRIRAVPFELGRL